LRFVPLQQITHLSDVLNPSLVLRYFRN
jgi:hypothetical protein